MDDNTGSTRRTLNDRIGQARFSSENAAAAEAVADARGLTVRGVSDPGAKYHNEVRRVRDWARDAAARKGTTVEEEAPAIAESIVRHEQAEREEQAERAQRTDARIIEAERHVLAAKRAVLNAIKTLNQVTLDDDMTAILTDAHNSLKAASALFDARLAGWSDTDWDAELARLA